MRGGRRKPSGARGGGCASPPVQPCPTAQGRGQTPKSDARDAATEMRTFLFVRYTGGTIRRYTHAMAHVTHNSPPRMEWIWPGTRPPAAEAHACSARGSAAGPLLPRGLLVCWRSGHARRGFFPLPRTHPTVCSQRQPRGAPPQGACIQNGARAAALPRTNRRPRKIGAPPDPLAWPAVAAPSRATAAHTLRLWGGGRGGLAQLLIGAAPAFRSRGASCARRGRPPPPPRSATARHAPPTCRRWRVSAPRQSGRSFSSNFGPAF